MKYVLALDQGTTSSRAIVFDEAGRVVMQAAQEFAQIFPQSGWVEHDANEIWQSQHATARTAIGLLAKHSGEASVARLEAVGITNQRETTVLWHRKTGEPLHNAIVWQDRRTAGRCEQLRQWGKDKLIQQTTGLVLDAYFSATKLEWLLDNVQHGGESARSLAERGELCFGTVDSWLIYKLTAGKVHATDVSNASRTMLFNIHTLQWDAALLRLFNIPASVLPTVVPSSGVLGEVDASLLADLGLKHALPIAGVAGDQQAATFGQNCFAPGTAKNTYGTGCFMLLNTGTRAVASKNKLLTTIGWSTNLVPPAYCLEGSVFMGGATIQWLRDGLQMLSRWRPVSHLRMTATLFPLLQD
jgi:glycerol kinase